MYIEGKDCLDYSPQDRSTYRAWLEPDSKEEAARELEKKAHENQDCSSKRILQNIFKRGTCLFFLKKHLFGLCIAVKCSLTLSMLTCE